eukprot:gene5864-6157_t
MIKGMRLNAAQASHQRRAMPSIASKQLVARSVRPTRRVVVTQANLFARVTRLIQSSVTNVVQEAEDPEKLLDQVVNEMQQDLVKMRQAAAGVMASQKQLEAKYKTAQNSADEWLRRAELAVSKEEDELAKEALKRRKAFTETATGLKMQLDMQQNAVDNLLGNTRVLENKLAEAKSKKDTLKARAASAKTSKQIQEMVGNLNTSNAMVAFNKMEEKVMAMEAEAESTQLLVGGDGLENRFALLESGTVDDELSALKKTMVKSESAPPTPSAPFLPEGRPYRDAFDLELDALRKKELRGWLQAYDLDAHFSIYRCCEGGKPPTGM